jgi:spore maturation protein CgeB
MKILYIGDSNINCTSYHRYTALKRIGHDVDIFDPSKVIKQLQHPIYSKFHYITGFSFISKSIDKWLLGIVSQNLSIELVWINGGEFFNTNSLNILRRLQCPIILYNNDDPTGKRDGNRFKTLIKTIPAYDLCVVVRDTSKNEFKNLKAKNVLQMFMSSDEIAHKPLDSNSKIKPEFQSDVAFIGTWMRHEKRDEFILELINKGLNVAIWGNRWQKSTFWNELKGFYRGGGISGEHYVAAIQGSKICLGLLSKGNRDLHTQRSLEIPYAGGLLCAERTTEHLALYEEGEEAVFWSDVDECALICKKLLADDALRERIRLNGMKRVRLNKVGNEDICREVLAEVEKIRENK